MIAVPIAVAGLLAQSGKRLVPAWKLTRTDGMVFRFTPHDRALSIGGATYVPTGGIGGSATRRDSALRDHNVETLGLINSAAITVEDLRVGRYRDCIVDVYLVDWRYPWSGVIAHDVYWVSSVSFTGEFWTAQMEGATRWLKNRLGEVFTRTCRHVLGDSGCGVSLGGFTVTGVVALGTVDGEKRRIVRADPASLSGTYSDSYFTLGKITCTAGANAGITAPIKTYTQATRDVEVQVPFPLDVGIGDTFTLVAGCNQLASTCLNKFNNVGNYGGFPYMPTTDKILRVTPKS